MQNRVTTSVSRVADFEMHGIQHSTNGRIAVLGFTVRGQLALPTRSFWQALFAQFHSAAEDGQTLDEAEFFLRLRKSLPDAEIRYEIDWDDEGNALLCAPRRVTKPSRQSLSIEGKDHHADTTYFMDAAPGTLRFSMN